MIVASILIPPGMRAQFSDHFSDGDMVAGPSWNGDTSKFEVDTGDLHLNAPPVDGEAHLSTGSKAIENAVWEFLLHMDFNPSANNYVEVYLVSDRSDVTDSLQGYFLRFGDTEDEVSLYRRNGTYNDKIIDGTDGRLDSSEVTVRARVTRDSTGYWELFLDTTGKENFRPEGSVRDTAHRSTKHFGILCTYTSTRADRIRLDAFEVSGDPFIDRRPPGLEKVVAVNERKVRTVYDEPLLGQSARKTTHYALDTPAIEPITAKWDTTRPSEVLLEFPAPFANGSKHFLRVQGVKDTAGNAMKADTGMFQYLSPDTATSGDVVINEIMADPTPPNELPAVEFLEVHNNSEKWLDLTDWTISDDNSTAELPSYALGPKEFAIITSAFDTAAFSDFPNTIGVFGFPSLNNSFDQLAIRAPGNELIDGVSYKKSWYGDPDKEDGGWTLERIDPGDTCDGAENWTASEAPEGGTPGKENTVLNPTPDTVPPSVVTAFPESRQRVKVAWNEELHTPLLSSSRASIRPVGEADSIWLKKDEADTLRLLSPQPLDTGKEYTVVLDSFADCPRNLTDAEERVDIRLPHSPRKGDIVINELLFDPYPGGSDFVELFNRSERYHALNGWALLNAKGDSVTLDISKENDLRVLAPGAYVAITEDTAELSMEYPSTKETQLLHQDKLPSYPNDSGRVVLKGPNGVKMEQFNYRESFHFPLLDDTEGVSLERMDPASPNRASNWHSAAESAGFATPGRRNSQWKAASPPRGSFEVRPELFFPGNDGDRDVTRIHYQLDRSGYVGTLTIFDTKGNPVRHLVQNELLGTTGAFAWNGLDDDANRLAPGIYIILIDVFNDEGDRRIEKKKVVVGEAR